jgi:DNA (cytosine-5)-methyltransferase 1
VAPFPKAVLAHHWPHVPDLGDLARIDGRKWRSKVDVLWGSLPCQSYSTIGKRKGLNDPRGALSLKFANLANQIDPDIIVIENAKGLLFDRQAFSTLLQALCGPHQQSDGRFPNEGSCSGPLRRVAWRTLDAADFGLPQHRERVFVVATSAASGIDPAEVLALGQGAPWGSRSRREDQPRAARVGAEGSWFVNGDTRPKVRFEQTATLRAEAGHAFVVQDGVARRLVATEWERLQGIPDGHSLIPWKRSMAPESLRKRAIGNSLAVPVVRWIGERIIACSDQAVVTEPEMTPLAA